MLVEDSSWIYPKGERPDETIQGTPAYRRTMRVLVDGLVAQGFLIVRVDDQADVHPDPDAAPGRWEHFVALAPPWLAFWTCYRPDMMETRVQSDE